MKRFLLFVDWIRRHAISILGVAFLIVFTIMCCLLVTRASNSTSPEAEIIHYLIENTEDSGDYVVKVEKADGYKIDGFNGTVYFAYFIDADGDFEMSVVKYDNGHIESYEFIWN